MSSVIIFSDTSIKLENFEDSAHLKELYPFSIEKSYPTRSAGAHRLATEVRNKNLQCQVISMFFYFNTEEVEQLCNKFINEETIIVAFSTTFWNNDRNFREGPVYLIDQVIKYSKKFPNIKVVFGGYNSKKFCEHFKGDDFFTGYGDQSFPDYIDYCLGIKQKDNVNFYYSKENDSFDFSKSQINYVKEDCLNFGESVTLEVSRGCIFKCDFCAFPLNGKKKYDYIKELDNLKNELIRNYEVYGITNYYLSDDTFNDSNYKIESLHKVFTSLPFKIKFSTYLRLDLLNAHRDQIDSLKEMGLVGAFFGIESFNHKSLQAVGKGIKPEKVKELLYDLKKTHWKEDVAISVGLITGLPYETYESHKDTIDWVMDENNLVDRVKCSALRINNPLIDTSPFVSEFSRNASKHGYYWVDKSHNWKNYSNFVKDISMAIEMSKEINQASKDTHRLMKGSFHLLSVSNFLNHSSQYRTLDEIRKLHRKDYTDWVRKDLKNMMVGYIDQYKRSVLDL
jgi:hypothetical protein